MMYVCKRCGWKRESEPKDTWDKCPNCDEYDWMQEGERNNKQWTTDPPTEEGWYWRWTGDSGDDPDVVFLKRNRVYAAWYDDLKLGDIQYWLGPLPVPTLPK